MIRVAILGAGIGRDHLEGYRALPEQFLVRTMCDLDTSRAVQAIENDPIRVETDIAVVLADSEIDLVDICLPPHLHFPIAMDALRAGKHVVCEKPLVSSLKDADALISAAGRAECILTPVFQYRYGPAMAQLSALTNAGLVGRAYAASLETHWNRDADYFAVPWRGTWAGENGGAVLGHAIHIHDLLTSVMGPVSRLSAVTATRVNDVEVEDCAAIALQMKSGAVATSSITLGAADNTSRLRFCFEKLTAESGSVPYAPATGRWKFTARAPADQDRIEDVLKSVGDVKSGFAGFFEALANDFIGHEARAVTAQDGRRSIELVTAIYYAMHSKRTVELPLGRNAQLYKGWAPTQK